MKKETRTTFITRLQNHFCQSDIQLIEYAYDLSKSAHRTQNRDSGERYFEHPRAGCLILMDELGLYDRNLLIGFLLHDVGEDTALLGNVTKSYDEFVTTARFRITRSFGPDVADIVIRLTKPSVDNVRFYSKPEAFDYYISELEKNPAAIIDKLTDRLHNLRSLPGNQKGKIQRQINETESVYIPMVSLITGTYESYAKILEQKIQVELSKLKTSLAS